MDGRGSVSGLFGVHMKMWEMLGWALPLPCLPPLDVHLTQTSGVSMKMQEPDFAKARARQKKKKLSEPYHQKEKKSGRDCLLMMGNLLLHVVHSMLQLIPSLPFPAQSSRPASVVLVGVTQRDKGPSH